MDRQDLFKRESECCACLEKKPLTVVIYNDTICHECLHYIFQKALNNEAEYPAKWGGITLNPKDYYHEEVVSQSFIRGYQEKQKEYHCQVARRIYCSWIPTPAYQGKGKGESNDQICQTFLGKNIQNPNDVVRNGGNDTITMCRKCHRPSCLACGERILHNTPRNPHKCMPLNAVDTEDAAFEGLKRGKDYQICPSERWGRRLELSDGCNHMKCMCGMEICFICGEPATANGGHWTQRPGGCPRYNQPAVNNALVDRGRIPQMPAIPMAFPVGRRHNDINQNGFYIPDPDIYNREAGTDHHLMDAEERQRLRQHMARWDRRAFDRRRAQRAERAQNPSLEPEQMPDDRDAAIQAPGNNPDIVAGENAVEPDRRAALRQRLGGLRDRFRRFTRRS